MCEVQALALPGGGSRHGTSRPSSGMDGAAGTNLGGVQGGRPHALATPGHFCCPFWLRSGSEQGRGIRSWGLKR